MFEEVVNQTPWPFRKFPRAAILKGLVEQGCGAVTEDILVQVCQEVSPEKYLAKTTALLGSMRTKATM